MAESWASSCTARSSGSGHVDQGWDATLTVGTLGAIWGTIYLLRRSIIAPMVSHAGFNLAQLVKFMALR